MIIFTNIGVGFTPVLFFIILCIIGCPLVLFPLAIALSVVLLLTHYDYPISIFKLFVNK